MIDTKALRSRILDLAIQGKLTQQLESDGTAEAFFSTKTKAITADTPFEIPSNWKWCRGIDCLKPMETRKPSGDTFSYIDIDAIDNKNQTIRAVRKVATKDAPSRASRAVFEGSVLFSLVRPYLRNIALVDNKSAASIASTGFFVATSNGSLYPLYLFYLMISDYVVMGLNEYMKGDNSPSIRKGHIEQWLFPVPPLAEQKRIVQRVEEIFKLLDTIDEAQEKYSADTDILKAKLITAGIQGKLTQQLPSDGTAEELYQQIQAEKQKLISEGKIKKEKPLPPIADEEIPFEIPGNWKWCKIGQVINEVIVPQRDKPSFSGDIPWCRIEDKDGIFLNGTKSGQYVSKETVEQMNLRVFPIGTVLSACSGASIGTILITTVECCTNQTFNGLVCNEYFYNWYLFWYLKSAISSLRKMGTGSAMAYISQDRIRNMPIPLPPLAEQKRIAETLEKVLGALA